MTKKSGMIFLKQQTSHVTGKKDSVMLENLIKDCEQTKASWGLQENDIAFVLAFKSMIECGFQCTSHKDKDVCNGQSKETLPENWKHHTRQIYEVQFVLPPHSDYPVKMVALPAGDILCINVLALNVSEKNINLKSLAIYSPGYVPRPEEDVVWKKISGLADFHFLLTNSLIWPIRCSILTDRGIMNGSLRGVSDEIKLKIIGYLPVKDVLMLEQTCHDLNRICKNQGLWKALFHEDFKYLCKCSTKPKDCDETTDWRERYIQAYIQKRVAQNFQNSPSGSYATPPEGPYGSMIDFEVD